MSASITLWIIRHDFWPPPYLADASNDAHAGFSLYRKFEILLSSQPTPPEREWYSFDAINGQLCRQDGTQWHGENPNYDPGPPPPPKLPREIKASMIINPESKAEVVPSATIARKNEYKFRSHKPERNNLALSTSQQPSAESASGSTQQLQPRGHGTYEHNPQLLPKNSGKPVSQHRPTGAQGASSTQCRVSSSNIRNERGQIDNGYSRRPRRRPRHPASQDTATTSHSWSLKLEVFETISLSDSCSHLDNLSRICIYPPYYILSPRFKFLGFTWQKISILCDISSILNHTSPADACHQCPRFV